MSDSDQEPVDAEVVDLDYIEPEGAPPALPAGEPVPLGQEPAAREAGWEEQAVGEHLKMAGEIVHELWGKAETDWVMSERDLERIGPPLTRILNRYEPTARAAILSDPILLGYGTTMYAYRSVLQARAAAAEQREKDRPADVETAGYERVVSQGPARDNGRSGGLRFPESARGAGDEGE